MAEKPTLKFKPLPAPRTTAPDKLHVNRAGMRIPRSHYKLMGYPEAVQIEISEDKRAIRLSVPGPFKVRMTDKATPVVNYRSIPESAQMGRYTHIGENVFVHE